MISLREIPLVRWIVPFIFGIIAVTFFELSPCQIKWIGHAILGLLFLGIVSYKYWSSLLGTILIIPLVFLIGYYLYASQLKDQFAINNFKIGQKQWFYLKLTDHPKVGYKLQAQSKILASLVNQDSLINTEFRAIANFKPDSLELGLQIGDELLVFGSIQSFKKQTNPYAFDYQKFMNRKGVFYQLQIDKWKIFEPASGFNIIFHRIESFRKELLTILKSQIKDEDSFMIAAAMSLGFREELSDDLYQLYANTGAVHILAVSGLHVGIVAGLIYFILGLIPIKNKIWNLLQILITFFAIWGFALISGFGPAVIRAAIMFTIFMFAVNLNKSTSAFNVIAFTAFVILIINPSYLFQIGFQLSFLAVVSIVFFNKYLKIYPRSNNGLIDKIYRAGAVTVNAQILVLPLVVFYFHKLPLAFLFSSVIAIPAAFAILSLCIALFFFHYLLPIVEPFTAILLSLVLNVFNSSIAFIGDFSFSSIQDIYLTKSFICCTYMTILFMMRYLYSKRITWIVPTFSFSIISIVLLLNSQIRQIEHQSITVYDVYGGTCIDFFDHGTCFTLNYGDVNESAKKFLSKENRIYGGISEVIDLKVFQSAENARFKAKMGLYQINELLISIPNENYFIVNDKIQFYIFSHEMVQNRQLEKMEQIADDALIIFDRSVRPWNKEKYLSKISPETKIYEINKNGAYYLEI